MKIFKELSKKLNSSAKKASNQGMIKPIDVDFDLSKNEFLDSLSKHALKLYEKQADIKNFTKLVLSDPENLSHNERVTELLRNGVKDPLAKENLEDLSNNNKLLKDLGLID